MPENLPNLVIANDMFIQKLILNKVENRYEFAMAYEYIPALDKKRVVKLNVSRANKLLLAVEVPFKLKQE